MDTTGDFKHHDRRIYLRQFLRIFLPMTAILWGVAIFFYQTEIKTFYQQLQASEAYKLRIAREIIQSQLHSLGNDAFYLSHQQSLVRWINQQQPEDKQATQKAMIEFAKHHPRYDQLRYLDETGKEVIRINVDARGRSAQVTADEALQDKSQRYYIQAIRQLPPDEIYVSPFDLNMENGQLSQPLKPMIRVGAPVYNEAGEFRGSLLLNYLGSHLLNALKNIESNSDLQQLWLLNDEGYWLLGPEPALEWGFMWPDRDAQTLPQHYPQLWLQLTSSHMSDIEHTAGLFLHQAVNIQEILPSKTGQVWHLVAFTPQQYIQQQTIQPLSGLWAFATLSEIFIVVFSLVIARKEVSRIRSIEQLKEQESRYRHLLEGAPDAIIIVNPQGLIRIANTVAEKAFGYDRRELIDQPIETLVPERFHRHSEFRQEYTARPAIRPMGENQELYAKCKDGSELPVEISLSPMVINGEKLITAVVRDVTTRKERDNWIKELNRKLVARSITLQTLNQELESFSYSVSHDLRAPLRAIDGFSKTIVKDYADQLDDRGRDRLERIRSAAQRMGSLIDDLLTLSRISRSDIHKTQVDVTEMAEQIIDDLRQLNTDRLVNVVIQPEMKAFADPRLLTIALTNLLSNAWKFTSRTQEASISLHCEEDKSRKVFIIKDNGAGFNAGSAGKLFGAFQRFHAAADFEGTGIGLATVKRIIHQHGGRIWAQSETGKGATFFFTLAPE